MYREEAYEAYETLCHHRRRPQAHIPACSHCATPTQMPHSSVRCQPSKDAP